MKSKTGIVLRARAAQMNLVSYMRKNELKSENSSLNITLNHNLRYNISSLCGIPVNLLRNNAL